MRVSLLLLVATCAVACTPAAPAPPAPPTITVPAAATASASTPAPPTAETPPPAILAAFAEHGALHGPAVHIPAFPGIAEPAHWVAFVGSPGVARAAWAIDGTGAPYPIAGWPVGVRVLASAVRELSAHVLVESVGVLDQPRGMRGVVRIASTGMAHSGQGSRPLAVSAYAVDSLGVSDAATLRATEERGRHASTGAELAQVQRAGASAGALAGALAPGGAEVFEIWQGSLLRPLGRVDAASIATSPERDAVLAALRSIPGPTGACFDGACSGPTAAVTFEAGALRAVACESPSQPAPATPGTPRVRGVIAGAKPSSATAARVRELASGVQLLTETRMGPTGTAAIGRSAEGLVAVLLDGDFGALVPVYADGPEVTLLDVGGNGELAVLAGEARRWRVSPIRALGVRTYPTNSTDLGNDESTLVYELAAMRATTPAEALAAVLAAPDEPVSRDEACALLQKAHTPAGFRAAAAPGAFLFRFAEPHAVAYHAEVVPAGQLHAGDLDRIDEGCHEAPEADQALVCRGSVCGVFNYALGNFHWFTRVNGKLRLRAAGIYVGS
jgi:hypothetical protein